MQKPVKKILVVNPNHLGDMIMDSPVFRVLKEKFPEAKLDVASYSFSCWALYSNTYIDNVLHFPTSTISQVLFALSLRSKKYDIILQLNTSFKTNVLMWLMGGKERVGYDYKHLGFMHTIKVPISTRTARIGYRVDESCNLLEKAFGWKITNRRMDFFIEDYAHRRTDYLDGNYIVLHPCFRRVNKNEPMWDPKKFVQLTFELSQKLKLPIFLTGSEEDLEYNRQIASGNPYLMDLTNRLTFNEFGALISKSKLLICTNSAPAHIAIATKVPVVVLIRAVPPYIALPSDNPSVIALEGQRDIPYTNYETNYEVNSFINTITVDEVVYSAEKLIGKHNEIRQTISR